MAFYVIEYRYNPDMKYLVADIRPAHRTYLRGLEAEGKLIASGFFRDAVFDGAMLIVKADSALEAKNLLDDDPFSLNGLIEDVRARLWVPTIGSYADDFDKDFPFS